MAGIPQNYNKNKLKKFNLTKTGNGYRLRLNFEPLGENIDRAQDALDAQVWQDVQRYMPIDTGALISRTNMLNTVQRQRGKVFLYPPDSDYGHYQHEGKLYVDPEYGKGAFYSPEYGFWSRPGVTKVESDRPLTYSNPNATAHWGETAFKNHKNDWLKVVERALKGK